MDNLINLYYSGLVDRDYEILTDLSYMIARKRKGKSLKNIHTRLITQLEPFMEMMAAKAGFGPMHEANIQAHMMTRDTETDERDERWYPDDRLHSLDEELQ